MTKHKGEYERTNNGCYFTDCTCGWSGGVYRSRAEAREAWAAHRDGKPIPDTGRMRPVIQVPPSTFDMVVGSGPSYDGPSADTEGVAPECSDLFTGWSREWGDE